MSAITLDQIIAAATSIESAEHTPGELVALLIKSIDAQSTPTPVKAPARKAAAKKAAVKPVAAVKVTTPTKRARKTDASTPNLRITLDGRTMKADPGTITKGQIARNTKFAADNGYETVDYSNYSMADAADDLFEMKADLNA